MKELYEVLNEKYGFSFRSNQKIRWVDFFVKVKNFDVEIAKTYHDVFNFNHLFSFYKLSENEIEELKDYAVWNEISISQKLSEDFIERHKNEVLWPSISIAQKLSEDFIERHADKIEWNFISETQRLSEDFIVRHIDKLNIERIAHCQKLSQSFIERYIPSYLFEDVVVKQYLDEEYIKKHIANCSPSVWRNISEFQLLSEEFIEANKENVFWPIICEKQKLSEEFIERHKDYVDWDKICMYQKLSEDFIRRNKYFVVWPIVSIYQKLSEKFIEEFIGLVNMKYISAYQKLSNEFIEKYGKLVDRKLIEENWIYKTKEEKKEYIVNTGLYECHDDYFIAYKAIRSDRYSIFNFQYKYEKGGVYESWCDCSRDICSFGLSVGTESHAIGYLSNLKGFIVRCKVRYEDVGKPVHSEYKDKVIRCFKLEILD